MRATPMTNAFLAADSALCGGLGVCPGPKKCYEKINDDRATYKEGVRATYRCAEGPPGSKWNLAATLPPLTKRPEEGPQKRAPARKPRMLEREAQPKQKPIKQPITHHTTPLLLRFSAGTGCLEAPSRGTPASSCACAIM